MANEFDGEILHTDDLIKDMDFRGNSEAVSYWLDKKGPWVIEGVTAIRALREWLKRNPKGKPCDYLVWLCDPFVPLGKGQEAMGKGCVTVFSEIKDELESRGVQVCKSLPN